jgi:hypothetical protein
MKPALIFTLVLMSTAAFVDAHAQTYQWKDSSGHTIISDTPPPGKAAKDARTIGTSKPMYREAPPVKEDAAKGETGKGEAAKATDAPKTTADKDLEFKKRQQDAKEKADKEAKEKAANAEKKDTCERARGYMRGIESGQPVSTTNEKGERQVLDDNQRQQEMNRARKIADDACK